MKAFYESRTYNSDIPVSISRIRDLDFVAHWHTDIEMVYVCEGRIGAGVNSGYRILHAGDVSICGSNDIHYYESDGLTSRVILLIFRPDLFHTYKRWPAGLQPCSLFLCGDAGNGKDPNIGADPGIEAGLDNEAVLGTGTEPGDIGSNPVIGANPGNGKGTGNEIGERIRFLFESIVSEMEQKNELYPLFADMRILELFLAIFRHLPAYYEESIRNSGVLRTEEDIKPMQKALRYLEENHNQEISLEQIANEANLSRFYFSRLFRKTTGMNFNAYLTRIRTDKAEELIRSTRKPIIEIAYETGFLSIRTFNRSFKAIKGVTPQSLRLG